MVTISEAKKIMGNNLIGPDQFRSIQSQFAVVIPKKIAPIPFSASELIKKKKSHVLILGITKMSNGKPLTLTTLVDVFGTDPEKSEPCMYNQDWYKNELFAKKRTVQAGWHLIAQRTEKKSRGKKPQDKQVFLLQPSAVLLAVTFFAFWFLSKGKKLWEKEYVWTSDCDKRGDRIYVGRYCDVKGVNKNGFNIHRHLTIDKSFGILKYT